MPTEVNLVITYPGWNEVEVEEAKVDLAGDLVQEGFGVLWLVHGPRLAALQKAHSNRFGVLNFLAYPCSVLDKFHEAVPPDPCR